MVSTSFLPLVAFAGLASAHFRLLAPTWRGDSFASGASQWTFPCANVNETSDPANRTQWPHTGGAVKVNGSHDWALTYVNLGLGTNVSSFNITLIENLNVTKGVVCFKEAGKEALAKGLKDSNITMEAMEGMHATVQVIQISHTGASLYNCADITFNSSAKLLSDDDCKNTTGVTAVEVANVGTGNQTGGSSQKTGAANTVRPAVGGGLLAALIVWGLL